MTVVSVSNLREGIGHALDPRAKPATDTGRE